MKFRDFALWKLESDSIRLQQRVRVTLFWTFDCLDLFWLRITEDRLLAVTKGGMLFIARPCGPRGAPRALG